MTLTEVLQPLRRAMGNSCQDSDCVITHSRHDALRRDACWNALRSNFLSTVILFSQHLQNPQLFRTRSVIACIPPQSGGTRVFTQSICYCAKKLKKMPKRKPDFGRGHCLLALTACKCRLIFRVPMLILRLIPFYLNTDWTSRRGLRLK